MTSTPAMTPPQMKSASNSPTLSNGNTPEETSRLDDSRKIYETVVRQATELLVKASQQKDAGDEREGQKLSRLMTDAGGKAFTFAMVDEVFRSHEPAVQAERFRTLLRDFGIPRYLPMNERLLMRAGGLASTLLPGVVMPQIAKRMRGESARVIVEGAPEPLRNYLTRRHQDGFRINLNHLGEAVLGEEEAARRLDAILGHLANPQVNYISVKISAIFSQINLLAWDETLKAIKDRLRRIYRAALPERKFVNLDMEEFRDLELTLAAFRDVLSEPEFMNLSAGIVLQAYLPDSWRAQQELTAWARQRVAGGGAEIKLRLVKGANLAMEAVEAEMHGWRQAPYTTMEDSAANFRRMLEFGCQPENAVAVRLGVASHNLFDVALAMVLRERFGTQKRVELEMLEGMANHQARAVRDAAGGLLLYAPAVKEDDFLSALAYLVRRLDENTSPGNFLRDMFGLKPGTPAWERQREKFEQGWFDRNKVGSESRRNRPAVNPEEAARFESEPDSDWTQIPARHALEVALKMWKPAPIPELPTLNDVLSRAVESQPSWEKLGAEKRGEILRECARVMGSQRFETMACLRANGKKALAEADVEISEAIDFARYYSRNFDVSEGVTARALGVVMVAPPWNFPYAIPCGGVLAAIMAGNAVVLKPAPETVEIAWLLARQLWQAGVPRDVLQFFPCADGETGRALITDERVKCVVLTGGYETARMFQSWRPGLNLLAETSGKNAMVITAQADRELAIKDLVRSAFGHAGQKCSAASLAIVEAEVYDDPVFRRQLRDAAASLFVGPATDPRSVVTPLIREAGEALRRALTQNEAGEAWLLEPKQLNGDPCLWSPGIKLGVQPGSWFHRTECFGPVLGLMRAESLEQAIDWQNATDYGLTAGLHSLDPREQKIWRERAQAGNLYINRALTGAIVQRQPFGGWKRSCIGPGSKAGGPNYVFSFCRFSDAAEAGLEKVASNYQKAWETHFKIEHDPSALRAESNVFRYRPSRGVILRVASREGDAIARAEFASRITGVNLTVSVHSEESDEVFSARLPELARHAEFLRTIGEPSLHVLAAAHAAGLNWIEAPVTEDGRMELRYWLREQAVSQPRHRYGQIPEFVPDTRRS